MNTQPALSALQGELLAFLKVQYNFRSADPDQLHKFSSLARAENRREGSWLFQEGDPVEGLWFLLEGAVNLQVTRMNDTMKMWADIPAPNMICGYEVFRGNGKHSENALCLKPLRAAIVPTRLFHQHLPELGTVAWGMADYLSFIIEERSQDVLCISAEDKINLYFRRQATYFRRYTLEGTTVKLYRDHIYEQIALMTGLTRETVNRQMKSMERDGRIGLSKDYILIKDSGLLR